MERKLQDIPDMELKALAYDHLAQLQALQNNLNAINAELNRRLQQQQGATPQFIQRPPMGDVQTV